MKHKRSDQLTNICCLVLVLAMIITILALSQTIPYSSDCPANCENIPCSLILEDNHQSTGPCFCSTSVSFNLTNHYCHDFLRDTNSIQYRFHNIGALIGFICILVPCTCIRFCTSEFDGPQFIAQRRGVYVYPAEDNIEFKPIIPIAIEIQYAQAELV